MVWIKFALHSFKMLYQKYSIVIDAGDEKKIYMHIQGLKTESNKPISASQIQNSRKRPQIS